MPTQSTLLIKRTHYKYPLPKYFLAQPGGTLPLLITGTQRWPASWPKVFASEAEAYSYGLQKLTLARTWTPLAC